MTTKVDYKNLFLGKIVAGFLTFLVLAGLGLLFPSGVKAAADLFMNGPFFYVTGCTYTNDGYPLTQYSYFTTTINFHVRYDNAGDVPTGGFYNWATAYGSSWPDDGYLGNTQHQQYPPTILGVPNPSLGPGSSRSEDLSFDFVTMGFGWTTKGDLQFRLYYSEFAGNNNLVAESNEWNNGLI